MMDDLAIKAYVNARVAFGDCPDVRLRTDDGVHPGAVFVEARSCIDREVLQLRYPVLRGFHDEPAVLNAMAEQARRRWGHEIDKREPAEPFDMDRLTAHVCRCAHPQFPLDVHVNQAWGGEMKMRLGRSEIVLSPTAYREIQPALLGGRGCALRLGQR